MNDLTKPPRRCPLLAPLAMLTLLLTVTACGDDTEEPVAPAFEEVDDDIGPDPSLVGLEVRARGDVIEVQAPIAFRIDKDGIGEQAEEPEFDDEDFDDLDLVEEGVLVIDVRETQVAEGTAVEVVGTVRQFDLAEAERLFDVDLDDDIYGAFEEELVIVADEVIPDPTASSDRTTTTAGTP